MNQITKTIEFGNRKLSLETGVIARQATGSVVVNYDETVVLVTVVARKEAPEGQDFFPLTVDYQEKTYAAGKIPGGFFKREGRPSEKEILTCRLIDRPLRPLFPDGFFNEVQVVATVLSSNEEVDSDIPAMIGASAALAISGIPFDGPIGAVRVGYNEDSYIINPSTKDLKESKLDLVIAGTRDAVLMVESEAQELSEEIMLGAVMFGHEELRKIINLIDDLVESAGKPLWKWEPVKTDLNLVSKIKDLVSQDLKNAYKIEEKKLRSEKIQIIKEELINKLGEDSDNENPMLKNDIKSIFNDIEHEIVRSSILNGEPRIDGRDTRTVRPINISPGILPRTHGSVLFTRGETQALVVATLGTSRDEQKIDSLLGEESDRFMLHYNFPPYSTGEVGRVGSPKRREIGHGRLAKRALLAVLPDQEEFGYSIRVVSEITESNGSSSMASVCGGCLALMDAGVPLKSHVAGIAMGLIKDGNKFAILTDILGDEDHLGDMDFKVAGTESGITALQMDIKIKGITKEIMQIALVQAKEARIHILKIMKDVVEKPRSELSSFAPRMIKLKVKPEKIRDVIGKGGAVIRSLTEETGTTIDIEDDGSITIACVSLASGQEAQRRIEEITAEVEVGRVYEGQVLKLLDFGAIVSVLPGKDGLLHISQIAKERVESVSDYLKQGQKVKVKVLEADDKGRLRLSMKEVIESDSKTSIDQDEK